MTQIISLSCGQQPKTRKKESHGREKYPEYDYRVISAFSIVRECSLEEFEILIREWEAEGWGVTTHNNFLVLVREKQEEAR